MHSLRFMARYGKLRVHVIILYCEQETPPKSRWTLMISQALGFRGGVWGWDCVASTCFLGSPWMPAWMNGKCEWKTAWDNRRRIQFNFTTIAGVPVKWSVEGGEALPVPNKNFQVNSKNTDSALAFRGRGMPKWVGEMEIGSGRGTMPEHTKQVSIL